MDEVGTLLTRREKIAVFMPLVLYLFYVVHLVFSSGRPFLMRWIDGSFGLFVALVGCNIIRKVLVDRRREEDGPDDSPLPPEERAG